MTEDTLSFGENGYESYEWRHIEIDYAQAIPIYLNEVQIGAMLPKALQSEGLNIIEMHGIEIYPEYRMRGFAEATVRMLLNDCDMMIGSITEDPPKPFWLAMGAEFRPIPLDAFGKTLDTVHTEEPVFFFITENEKARGMGERYAREVPNIMREFNKLPKDKQLEILKNHGN